MAITGYMDHMTGIYVVNNGFVEEMRSKIKNLNQNYMM
jgi:hypothetical protein